jgi:hypothetical protein
VQQIAANVGKLPELLRDVRGRILMKLADVDVYELVHALGMERSAWLNVATEENRRNTEAERITICVLAALESALKTAASSARIHRRGNVSSEIGR